ncbi:DUF2125 domain-containing protein [Aliiroseovarius subalbicans]|uniref:DUF2125 domain-containing protein n=1 Tax=Aliiroseovarius subalbicans TaxID=2925840 RepID=UPI001F5791CD|nr:DUF2125 domain-containing protein [Aliiroseovarius subalbicans]MCI2400604.1 DUF2125 domain-containing protein [Aliiroseovarius subalbicans]
MRKLLVIATVLAVIWGAYWLIGASAMEKALKTWIADRQGEGWVAEYSALDTNGFPNRFDTTIEGLELADPDTGLAWAAPWFQILSLSYSPHHVIAVWPDTQTLATPNQRIKITTADMRGSVVLDVDTSLPLNRSSIVMERMELASSEGWTSSLKAAQLATRQAVGGVNTYDLNFSATGFTPASSFVQSLEQDALLPPVIDGMSIEATVSFDAPWDRFAIERARPQVTRLDLQLLKADWGDLDLWMAGAMDVDADGVPTGEITVKAKNWREMVAIARVSGLLPAAMESTVISALTFLSGLSGDPETLDAPLSLKNGRVYLGPFPVGAAPRIVIR